MSRSHSYHSRILVHCLQDLPWSPLSRCLAKLLLSSGVESTPIVPSRITANCAIFQSVQNSDRRIQYAGIRNTSFTSTGA